MNRLSYTAAAEGAWIAVASDAHLVVLHPDASERVADLWEAVNGPGAFSAVIRILARDGFSALPEFAVVDASSSRLRVIVRGAVSLEIDDAHGTHSQDGSDVSTWTERTFDGATAVRVSVDDAVSAVTSTVLPLVRGAARMSSCTLDLDLDLGERSPEPAREGTESESVALVEATLLAAAITERVDAVSETTVSAVADADRDDDSDALTGDTVFVPRRRPAPAASEDEAAVSAPQKQLEKQPEKQPEKEADEQPEKEADEQSVAPADDEPAPLLAGDHDGMTILSSELPKGRAKSAAPAAAARPATSPIVLVAADEERHPLDQPIIVGRAPSATQVSGGRLPRLVTIGGSDPDISRTHARFALEGDSVVVTDLHSRNGTLIVLPGKSPQKLRAGEPTTVIVGTVVDLGGGITFRVDG